MIKESIPGTVGKRGAIVLPAATRRRYGLADGSLFISEEHAEGILIRPAKAVPTDLDELKASLEEAFDELDRGGGISGEEAMARIKRKSAKARAQRK